MKILSEKWKYLARQTQLGCQIQYLDFIKKIDVMQLFQLLKVSKLFSRLSNFDYQKILCKLFTTHTFFNIFMSNQYYTKFVKLLNCKIEKFGNWETVGWKWKWQLHTWQVYWKIMEYGWSNFIGCFQFYLFRFIKFALLIANVHLYRHENIFLILDRSSDDCIIYC